jgi:soluble lytic murein transglycosylase-like protein
MKAEVKNYSLAFFLAVVTFSLFVFATEPESFQEATEPAEIDEIFYSNDPPSIELFNSIEKYTEQYQIPRKYAYGIAYSETRYKGPFDWNYKHDLTSSAGAVGPMQVMYATAKGLFPDKDFTTEYLRTNIDFNVECSMKLLRRLYDKYGDWKLVFGCYNTGRPIVNDYAEKVFNFKKNVVVEI